MRPFHASTCRTRGASVLFSFDDDDDDDDVRPADGRKMHAKAERVASSETACKRSQAAVRHMTSARENRNINWIYARYGWQNHIIFTERSNTFLFPLHRVITCNSTVNYFHKLVEYSILYY